MRTYAWGMRTEVVARMARTPTPTPRHHRNFPRNQDPGMPRLRDRFQAARLEHQDSAPWNRLLPVIAHDGGPGQTPVFVHGHGHAKIYTMVLLSRPLCLNVVAAADATDRLGRVLFTAAP